MNEIKEKLEEISKLLGEIECNAGDNLGRDGEYLSDSINIVIEKVNQLKE